MLDIDAIRDELENSPERIYRRTRQDYRRPVGSEGWEFEVYVLSDTASEDAFIGSGVYLVHRANFIAMVEKFDSEGWPWFVTAQAFSVPVDAPAEALQDLADAARALSDYPVLDEELYSQLEYDVVVEAVEEKANQFSNEYDVDIDDIMHVVHQSVFDSYEFDGMDVYVDEMALVDDVEEYLKEKGLLTDEE